MKTQTAGADTFESSLMLPFLKGVFIQEYESDVTLQHSMINGFRLNLVAELPAMDYDDKKQNLGKDSKVN